MKKTFRQFREEVKVSLKRKPRHGDFINMRDKKTGKTWWGDYAAPKKGTGGKVVIFRLEMVPAPYHWSNCAVDVQTGEVTVKQSGTWRSCPDNVEAEIEYR